MPDESTPKLYTTIKNDGYSEYEEKRSVFIGRAVHLEDEGSAAEYIRSVKAKHHDARHNVSAYLLRSGSVRCSDDGEPQGSAGVPVLDCIRKAGVTDACVVVTRYFGGILLGTGGLLRAYTKAASAALEAAGIVTYEMYTVMSVCCSYSDYQRISFELSQSGAVIDSVDYTDEVRLCFAVRETVADTVIRRLREICAGRCEPVVRGQRFGA